jgi:hypothetical protein
MFLSRVGVSIICLRLWWHKMSQMFSLLKSPRITTPQSQFSLVGRQYRRTVPFALEFAYPVDYTKHSILIQSDALGADRAVAIAISTRMLGFQGLFFL